MVSRRVTRISFYNIFFEVPITLTNHLLKINVQSCQLANSIEPTSKLKDQQFSTTFHCLLVTITREHFYTSMSNAFLSLWETAAVLANPLESNGQGRSRWRSLLQNEDTDTSGPSQSPTPVLSRSPIHLQRGSIQLKTNQWNEWTSAIGWDISCPGHVPRVALDCPSMAFASSIGYRWMCLCHRALVICHFVETVT